MKKQLISSLPARNIILVKCLTGTQRAKVLNNVSLEGLLVTEEFLSMHKRMQVIDKFKIVGKQCQFAGFPHAIPNGFSSRKTRPVGHGCEQQLPRMSRQSKDIVKNSTMPLSTIRSEMGAHILKISVQNCIANSSRR